MFTIIIHSLHHREQYFNQTLFRKFKSNIVSKVGNHIIITKNKFLLYCMVVHTINNKLKKWMVILTARLQSA